MPNSKAAKQAKLDRQAAAEILTALNDFTSLISDVSNATGYSVPDLYMNSLACLHRELREKLEN